ncbi:EAL domain-containing protein [Aeromonas encheleia]
MFILGFDVARPCGRLLCALLVFVSPASVGLWELHSNYLQTLDRQSELAATKAVGLMEAMLHHAEGTNKSISALINHPCHASLLALRKEATLAPFVRSASLINHYGIYCNSLLGDVHWEDDVGAYSGGFLRLLPGNQVRANHPMLAVRSEVQDGAVLSTIDSEYLKIMLALSAPVSGEVQLHVGNAWLDERGQLMEGYPRLPIQAVHRLKSGHYPLSVYAGFELPSIWGALWRARHLTILMLLGFSLCISLLVWWLLGRPRSMEGELKRALRAREFVPYLQPLVTSGDGKVMGAEVLMRWQHPNAGLIRPDLFIPQAEVSGLIVPMTSLIMAEVGQRLAAEQRRLPEGFHISFNISAAHCRDYILLRECREFLARFEPGKVVLVIELTERELLVADAHTLSLFKQLDEMGVKLAVDDFGTGHSSLVYLQQFNVDYLKIDQSFIGRIGTESLSEHIVDNVIDLGHRLGLTLIAEGVETRQQANYLKGKVAYLQGYLFGHPVPLCEFQAVLRRPAAEPAVPAVSA